jgi:hypothetical protein
LLVNLCQGCGSFSLKVEFENGTNEVANSEWKKLEKRLQLILVSAIKIEGGAIAV